MMAACIAASTMFFSCTDTEVEDPLVSVKATYGANNAVPISPVGGVVEADLGTIVTFDVTFTMGSNKIDEIHIKSKIGDKTFHVLDTVELTKGLFNSKGGKSVEWKYVTNVGFEEETLTFSTIDTKKNSAEFSLKIKKPDPIDPNDLEPDEDGYVYISQSVILLGGQNNASAGSFYSVGLGKIMTIGAANSSRGDVDFAYYVGAAKNLATIAAPANTDVGTISYGSTKIQSWSSSEKKNTQFYKIPDVNGNSSAVSPADWWAEIEELTTENHANKLAIGDVVLFKTDQGTKSKKGAFVVKKFSSSTPAANGSIEIELIERVEVN